MQEEVYNATSLQASRTEIALLLQDSAQYQLLVIRKSTISTERAATHLFPLVSQIENILNPRRQLVVLFHDLRFNFMNQGAAASSTKNKAA